MSEHGKKLSKFKFRAQFSAAAEKHIQANAEQFAGALKPYTSISEVKFLPFVLITKKGIHDRVRICVQFETTPKLKEAKELRQLARKVFGPHTDLSCIRRHNKFTDAELSLYGYELEGAKRKRLHDGIITPVSRL